jgi:L-rhamnonate dehydratase
MAAAYDIPVIPHGSGPYSFQAIMTFPNSDFCEYIVSSRSSSFLELRTSLRSEADK